MANTIIIYKMVHMRDTCPLFYLPPRGNGAPIDGKCDASQRIHQCLFVKSRIGVWMVEWPSTPVKGTGSQRIGRHLASVAEYESSADKPDVWERCRPPLWSSGQSFWLQIQRSRVRFPALPDFLSTSGSGTGSTQPREVN